MPTNNHGRFARFANEAQGVIKSCPTVLFWLKPALPLIFEENSVKTRCSMINIFLNKTLLTFLARYTLTAHKRTFEKLCQSS